MRTLACLAVLGGFLATPALACDFHYGRFGAGEYTGYETAEDIAAMREREAEILAERERAMAEARQNFLTRFDIKTDEAVAVASISTDAVAKASTNADRSPVAQTQDR